ncbi:MAG: hypothetical protein FJ403_18215 [Verrucomicrobia bacterium]|nr:hypothetical protein [Verrucomicrobiota bacterium]
MTERERNERAWLENEVRLAQGLTDADRIRILRDLLRTVDAIRRSKSKEQIQREDEVRWQLEDGPARERYAKLVDRLA